MNEVWHIIPLNDLEEHSETLDCACDPHLEIFDKGTLVIHNAYDNREIGEDLIEAVKKHPN